MGPNMFLRVLVPLLLVYSTTAADNRVYNFLRQDINVGDIASFYENKYPPTVLRNLDPSIVTRATNPILSYSMLTEGTAQLPLVVQSLLTKYTLRDKERKDNFSRVDYNYVQMQRIQALDERGHIVASRFHGPTEIYNIIPQLRQQNRGVVSRWKAMEDNIAAYLKRTTTGYIEHTVVLSYDFSDPAKARRPNAIGLRLRVYNDSHVLCDLLGNPVASNPYENIYYSNHPDYCCLSEGGHNPN